jgi:hypothetical protein
MLKTLFQGHPKAGLKLQRASQETFNKRILLLDENSVICPHSLPVLSERVLLVEELMQDHTK